jgi:hypothetical protein
MAVPRVGATPILAEIEESVMAGERRQFVSYFRQLSRAGVRGGQVAFTVLTCPDRTSARQ